MKLVGKQVTVTGGAGFIGSHLVAELAHDNDVTVLDDFSTGRRENLQAVGGYVRIRQVDISDRSALRGAMDNVEVFFHLAVSCLRTSIANPLHSHAVNDTGTLNLLLAADTSSLERFVYVSSSEVYGNAVRLPMDEDHPLQPTTPYGASKLAGEAYALAFFRTYGLPVTVVRPFNSYGPRAHLDGASGEVIPKFVARALAGMPLMIFGDGHQTRDYTWVEDTVAGIRLAAECDDLVGDCVNIAHGRAVSINTIASTVQELLRREVPIVHRPARPGDVRRQEAGVTRAQELLQFRANVDIREGLRRYIDSVRTLPGDPRSWLRHEQVENWKSQPLPV